MRGITENDWRKIKKKDINHTRKKVLVNNGSIPAAMNMTQVILPDLNLKNAHLKQSHHMSPKRYILV